MTLTHSISDQNLFLALCGDNADHVLLADL